MFHFTKSFGTFARAYGMQEGSGLPELHAGVVPVAVVDEAGHLVGRDYPTYTVELDRVKVTAVYSIGGIFCGQNPCVIDFAEPRQGGVADIYALMGIADLRTANTGALVASGLARGGTITTTFLTGTTTVAPGGAVPWTTAWSQVDTWPYNLFGGLVLRPGEYVWFGCSVVNIDLLVTIRFHEFTFPVPPLPEVLRP